MSDVAIMNDLAGKLVAATTPKASGLTWKTIDPKSLGEKHAKLFAAYKAAYKTASEARKVFEETMNKDAGLPSGKALVFCYRFGQLGMAISNKAETKTNSKAVTLAAYLAAQTA